MTSLAFFVAGLLAVALRIVPLPALIGVGGVIVAAGIMPLRNKPNAVVVAHASEGEAIG